MSSRRRKGHISNITRDYSAFANTLGLAVDRVVSIGLVMHAKFLMYLHQIEFEVVTPTGEHMKANACSNSDLFFALRGGGGGTFAVVINATMKALPPMSFPVCGSSSFCSVIRLKHRSIVSTSSLRLPWTKKGSCYHSWLIIPLATHNKVTLFLSILWPTN